MIVFWTVIIVLVTFWNIDISPLKPLKKWCLDNVPMFIATAVLSLAFFTHFLFKWFFARKPITHRIMLGINDVKHFFEYILKNARGKSSKELYVTHIYANPFDVNNDAVLLLAQQKEKQGEAFRISRIIGVHNSNEKQIVTTTNEARSKMNHVDIDIYIINLGRTTLFEGIPNVVIRDEEEALLIFPSRTEGSTRGVYISDPETIKEVIKVYWLKIKDIAQSATPHQL